MFGSHLKYFRIIFQGLEGLAQFVIILKDI